MFESPMHALDVRVLNPFGVEIDLPFWAFKRLKTLHLLERDRQSGKHRISEHVFGLMELWEEPEFRPNRGLRALPPGLCPARPKQGGHANPFLKALGRDCSGLA